jgi:hypothetical protein
VPGTGGVIISTVSMLSSAAQACRGVVRVAVRSPFVVQRIGDRQDWELISRTERRVGPV